MAKVRPVKTNFTNGEVDPLITMRSDLELFVNGASKIRNALPFPQGGFRRRDGLETVDRIPSVISTIALTNFTIANAGNNYTEDDVLTISGGTFTTAATITVDGLGGDNGVGDFRVSNLGRYTVAPSSPATVTGGTGTGATFNFDVEFRELPPISLTAPTVTSAGSGYAVGEVLTATGGTLSEAGGGTSVGLVVRVATITGGASTGPVGTIEVISIGDYEIVPFDEPADTTSSGSGTGATLSWDRENQDTVKLIDFSFSLDQNYIIVFTVGRLYVFRKEDTGLGPNKIVEVLHNSPYTNQQLKEITWTQSLDVMIIFHKDLPMRKLVRADETDWTFGEFFPNNPPTFAFGNIQTQDLTVTGLAGAVVGTAVTMTTNPASFTSAAEDVGKFIRIINATDSTGLNFSSYYKITAFTSTTVVTGMIIVLPIITSTTASLKVGGSNWLLEEVEFSNEHGYPRCGQFYQGRLVTAATKDRPQTMFTSRAGDIDDFNSGTTADDLGIVATIDSGTQATIQNIHAGRHLQFFADNSEYYIPISEVDPITPLNVALRQTSSVGSMNEIPVFNVDGTVYFVQRGGRSFREFSFVDGVKAYESNIVSLFSSHLIRNPSDSAFKKSLSTEDGNYIWVVNDEDFSLAAFSILKSELINAWSLQTTEGEFRGVAVSDQDSYFHVRRWPGGVIKYSGLFTNLEEAAGANSNPQGCAYSSDGLKMFMVSNQTDTVYEFALNFKNSLERVVYTGNSFDVSPFIANPKEIVISPDGLKMFIMDLTNDDIHEFDMGEPDSLADGNVTDSGFTLDYSAVAPTGTGFDIIGKNVIIVGAGADKVFLFNSTSDYTFEGGTSYSGKSFDLSAQATNPQDVKWSGDGKRFFVVDGATETLYQYSMTSVFDPETASYTGDFLFTGDEDGNPFGMSFSSDRKTLIISGTENDNIYQYDLSNPDQFGKQSDWIEFFQRDLKFDAAVCKFSGITTPVTGVTSQLQLINEKVGVIVDDVIYEDQVVDENGDLTFPVTAKYNYQVGLPFPNVIVKDKNNEDVDTGFNVFVQTLPADVLLDSGTTMGKKKRVSAATVRFVDTQGFYLQGKFVTFRNLPSVLDRPIPLQTGEKELRGLPGWNNFGQITIGQREPLAMTILGLGYDLSTGT